MCKNPWRQEIYNLAKVKDRRSDLNQSNSLIHYHLIVNVQGYICFQNKIRTPFGIRVDKHPCFLSRHSHSPSCGGTTNCVSVERSHWHEEKWKTTTVVYKQDGHFLFCSISSKVVRQTPVVSSVYSAGYLVKFAIKSC